LFLIVPRSSRGVVIGVRELDLLDKVEAMNPDNVFLPLSFIAGPAILMNACAVMQNGASLRYTLAINLWRVMCAEAGGGSGPVLNSYSDPAHAMSLAAHRIKILLAALNLLSVTVAGFGVATLAGLIGSFVHAAELGFGSDAAVFVVIGSTTIGTGGLLAAMAAFVLESRATHDLLRLQTHHPTLTVPDKAAGPIGDARGA
jgi:hypothetical protein